MTDEPELLGDVTIRDALEAGGLDEPITPEMVNILARLPHLTAERVHRIIYEGKRNEKTTGAIVNLLLAAGKHAPNEPEPGGGAGPSTLAEAREEAEKHRDDMHREKRWHEQERARAMDLVRTLKAKGTLQDYVERVAAQSRRPEIAKLDPLENYTLRMTILGLHQADQEQSPTNPGDWAQFDVADQQGV